MKRALLVVPLVLLLLRIPGLAARVQSNHAGLLGVEQMHSTTPVQITQSLSACSGQSSLRLRYLIGIIWWSQGRQDTAIQQCWSNNPWASHWVSLSLIQSYRANEPEQEDWFAALQSLTQTADEQRILHYYRGLSLFAKEDYSHAVEEFDIALQAVTDGEKDVPTTGQVHIEMGKALEKLGLWPQAKEHYIQATRYQETAADAYYLLGSGLLFYEKDFASADAALRQADELNPQDTSSLVRLADGYRKEGRAAEAEAIYDTLLQRKNPGRWAYVGKGILLMDRNEFAEALSYFLECIHLYPEAYACWKGAGLASMQLGDPQNAISYLETAGRLYPSRSIWNSLAEVYLKIGDNERATFYQELAKNSDK